jgi:DNA repair exonuclease SbcCD ATPase subunit
MSTPTNIVTSPTTQLQQQPLLQQPQVVPQHVPNAPTSDQNSLVQQVAAQEKRIAELTNSLGDRNQQLQKFQSEKKAEMEALMTGMKSWISNLDVKSDSHKEEFTKGLERLVDTSSFDNGVWQVMTCASASAAKQEELYQTLKTQYDELQTRSQGGVFGNTEHRIGDKRRAADDPAIESSAVPDIWSSFIADVSKTGYQVM